MQRYIEKFIIVDFIWRERRSLLWNKGQIINKEYLKLKEVAYRQLCNVWKLFCYLILTHKKRKEFYLGYWHLRNFSTLWTLHTFPSIYSIFQTMCNVLFQDFHLLLYHILLNLACSVSTALLLLGKVRSCIEPNLDFMLTDIPGWCDSGCQKKLHVTWKIYSVIVNMMVTQ